MTGRGTYTLLPRTRLYYPEIGVLGSKNEHWDWHSLTPASSPEVGAAQLRAVRPEAPLPFGNAAVLEFREQTIGSRAAADRHAGPSRSCRRLPSHPTPPLHALPPPQECALKCLHDDTLGGGEWREPGWVCSLWRFTEYPELTVNPSLVLPGEAGGRGGGRQAGRVL